MSRRTRVLLLIASLAAASRALGAGWIDDYLAAARRASSACAASPAQPCRDALREAARLTDERPDYLCGLAEVEARLRDAAAARDLRACVASGLDSAALLDKPEIRARGDHARLQALRRRLAVAVPAPVVIGSLHDPDLIAEDLAFDPADGSFLVSSVRERKIVRLARDGRSSDLHLDPDGWMAGVFAVSLDARRNVLWATTTADAASPPFAAADGGRSAVLKIDRQSGRTLARLTLDDGRPHAFGDAALDDEGTLYVSDGRGGGVYSASGGEPRLVALVEPGSLRSPQTPAPIAGRRLLIPDYSRGIAVLDLTAKTLGWLPHPRELALFGIDGLYSRGRTLAAIQNGTSPERVLLLKLDRRCSSVESWRVVAARTPGLGDPTHGAIIGNRLYFLANSGWDRVGEDGRYEKRAGAHPAQIWAVGLPPLEEC